MTFTHILDFLFIKLHPNSHLQILLSFSIDCAAARLKYISKGLNSGIFQDIVPQIFAQNQISSEKQDIPRKCFSIRFD